MTGEVENMNRFQSLFHSRDKPKNYLSSSFYSFFFGSTSSGKPVNETTAMQMTAVYSCVRILSETVAGLPLNVYRYNDSGGKEKAFKHPLYRLLHDEPNPEMTSFAFRETLMSHLLLWGNAYAQIIRNARGEVIAIYPLMDVWDKCAFSVDLKSLKDAPATAALTFRPARISRRLCSCSRR